VDHLQAGLWAQGDPLILVAHAASREMNPTLRQADIDREMVRDPAAGLAEYYAEFRTDIRPMSVKK
jgi:hypothetical protein